MLFSIIKLVNKSNQHIFVDTIFPHFSPLLIDPPTPLDIQGTPEDGPVIHLVALDAPGGGNSTLQSQGYLQALDEYSWFGITIT